MIDSIEIKNFRCFDKISLSRLKRINIVVGKSASGKTAFLESLFLTAGSTPELAIRVRGWRGLQVSVVGDQKSVYEALWKDLFFAFDQSKEISVTLKGGRLNTRSLVIGYNDPPDLIPIDLNKDSRQAEGIRPITFAWTDGAGIPFVIRPEVKAGQLLGRMVTELQKEGHVAMPAAFYSSVTVPSPDENAQYFSNLSVAHEENPITEFISREFPFVYGLSVEAFARTPIIYASVRGLSEKQPINMLSSGITKILSIVLGMAHQKGGVILIDEMENGIYWDRLASIWKELLKFSRNYDVQIFATTHSMECLQAAAEAASENEDDFCLMRIKKENGASTIEQASGKSFRAAIELGSEVR